MVKNIIIKKRFWAAILVAQFLLFYLFSKIEFIISIHEYFFEIQKKIHQQIFSWISFSLGDVFYIFLGFFLIYFLIQFFRKKGRNQLVLRFLIFTNVIYFIYQIFWGMLYFQQPLIKKFSEQKATVEETKTLALKYLELAKTARKSVKEDENGVFKISDIHLIKKEILNCQSQIPTLISTKKTTEIHTIKPSIFKGIMSYSGILGYYNPFTAEAQFNSELPSSYIPFTLAHETSHQLGFAREQEANFIGFLVGKDADNSDLKYSTHYYVLKSLLNSLAEQHPEFVKQVVEQYSEGMKRDRVYEKNFRKKHEGFLDVFFGFTNDLFLKSNQQDGSITYSYFNDLLIRYERIQHRH